MPRILDSNHRQLLSGLGLHPADLPVMAIEIVKTAPIYAVLLAQETANQHALFLHKIFEQSSTHLLVTSRYRSVEGRLADTPVTSVLVGRVADGRL